MLQQGHDLAARRFFRYTEGMNKDKEPQTMKNEPRTAIHVK